MRSTLIIGCGFLGQRVGKQLHDRGETVFGTTRKLDRQGELAAAGIEPIVADVLDPSSLVALPNVDRILYCVGFDRTRNIPMRTVYVDGLRNVLTEVGRRTEVSPPRLVYASSTGVYARDDGGWVDEDYPAEPRHESGKVCLEAEGVARSSGLPLCILRFSGLYGSGRIMRMATLAKGEPVIGNPDKWLNVIHIDDAATAAVAALDQVDSDPIYVISDDRPVLRSEFYTLAARCLSAPPPSFILPEPGSPEAKREESNKRASNKRMKERLHVALKYPDITTGLPAILAEPGS